MTALSTPGSVLALAVLLLGVAGPVAAQRVSIPEQQVDLNVDSTWLDNRANQERVLFQDVVRVPGVPWMRLFFARSSLPVGSWMRLTSLQDQAEQRLDAVSLSDYGDSSCFFNGDAVRVELLAAPNTIGNRILVVGAVTGQVAGGAGVARSICGTKDDRVQSFDKRQGRLSVGCTGWLISKEAFATAGHCMGNSSQLLEFNVPKSSGSGGIVRSRPDDQYPVILSSVKKLDRGVGEDWAVGKIGRNSNTNRHAGEVQGNWYVLGAVPGSTAQQRIRITGYGSTYPKNSLYLVQKTHEGPLSSLAATYLRYRVDTTGGNSGSPVIHENTGRVIGIHSHAGCTTSSNSANHGTRLDRSDIQAALRTVLTKSPGSFRTFGAGCVGSRGVPSMIVSGTPEIGYPLSLLVSHVPFQAPGVYLFGASDKSSGALSLPFDLAPFGMPGCAQLVSFDAVVPQGSLASGFAYLSTTIPVQPGLIGVTLYVQYAVHDQGANGADTVTSNAAGVTLGG